MATRLLSSRMTHVWKLFPLIVVPFLSFQIIYGWIGYLFRTGSFGFVQLSLFTLFAATLCLVSFRVFLPLKTIELHSNFLRIGGLLTSVEVPLSEIVNIVGPDGTTLRRITIDFQSATKFGRQVSFSPALFQADSVAEVLREQI